MTPRQLTVLLALGFIWGGSFLLIRVLVDAGVDPIGVAAGRLAVGAMFLVPLSWIVRDQLPRDVKTWSLLAGLGIFNVAVPWTLFPVSEQHIPSGVASIANSCTPLWASVFAAASVPGEHFTSRRGAGLALGFLGIAVLVANDLGGIDGGAAWGILGVVLATLLYGASAVFIRLRLSHVRPIALTVGQIGFAATVMVPLALATHAYAGAHMGAAEWASIAALGGLGSGVAVIAYMWLIGSVGPVRASVVTYLMPPVGVLLGWAVLDEQIGWNLVLAILLIVSGVALVQNLPVARLPGAAYRRFTTPSSAPAEP